MGHEATAVRTAQHQEQHQEQQQQEQEQQQQEQQQRLQHSQSTAELGMRTRNGSDGSDGSDGAKPPPLRRAASSAAVTPAAATDGRGFVSSPSSAFSAVPTTATTPTTTAAADVGVGQASETAQLDGCCDGEEQRGSGDAQAPALAARVHLLFSVQVYLANLITRTMFAGALRHAYFSLVLDTLRNAYNTVFHHYYGYGFYHAYLPPPYTVQIVDRVEDPSMRFNDAGSRGWSSHPGDYNGSDHDLDNDSEEGEDAELAAIYAHQIASNHGDGETTNAAEMNEHDAVEPSDHEVAVSSEFESNVVYPVGSLPGTVGQSSMRACVHVCVFIHVCV